LDDILALGEISEEEYLRRLREDIRRSSPCPVEE
jgi:hypothetical protein